MSAQFVAALEAEMAALREALSRDVRYLRLMEMERLRELYREPSDSGSQDSDQAVDRYPGGLRVAPKPPVRKASPERERAIEAARLLITNRTGPVPTVDVYDHIVGLGITIRGENPVNNLSAMLSNSGLFKANGRAGWTMRDDDDGADGDEEPSPEDQRNAQTVRDAEIEREDVLGAAKEKASHSPPTDDDGEEEAPQGPQGPPPLPHQVDLMPPPPPPPPRRSTNPSD
ncbi:MAG: hypothetical protein WAP03_26845 [Methylorubrum rhodinum]|uniref:hypothetical protein n=1 Tax=Methylorubrum rhodinum TaxID=29428 RepID=UPI003BB1F31F